MAVVSTPVESPLANASAREREAFGKQARKRAPRSSHGEWAPASDRADPVEILERQAADRIPELVPLRYGRMLASPFAFYRGAAAIMAADLAATPSSGLWVQACGDAHLSNFGMYASPSRDLVADVNDFDETLPGPWEWDLKRLAASSERLRMFEAEVAKMRRKTRMRAFSKLTERVDGSGAGAAATRARLATRC
jgi:hypothetical protein